MKLCDALYGIKAELLGVNDNTEIIGITHDSRKVKPGMLFAALPGADSGIHGMTYAEKALAAGAVAVLCDTDGQGDVPVIKVLSSEKAYSLVAANLEDRPAEKLKLIGVTGTNGKTTTVNFLNQILNYAKVNNFLLGNVGTPFSQELDNITSNDKVILEVSSFQLEYAFDLKIPCTAFLNITPDHLDRYKNFDEYFQTKCKLLDFTTQLMILNYDDPYLKNLQPNFKNIQYFSTQPLPKDYNGIYLDQNFIHLQKNKKSKPILDISNLALIGEHNIQNLMCAVLFALNEKIELSCLQSAINNLTLPKYRLEFVDSINGVDYYNDSKSTNSHSCLVATQCFKKPTWLLLGGSNKGEDFTNLIANLPSNIKTVVTFGQTGKKLFKLAKKFNLKTLNFPHLINAFDYASANAKAGEIILLSPACASFDEFANYYDRGEFFNNLVSELKLER